MSEDQNVHILVVEDNEKIRKLLCSILRNVGYTNLSEAENGLTAWQKLQASNFDLVLTDWMMPEMDGLELLKKIRTSSEHFQKMPVMMITASDSTENIVEAAQWKINGYIVKPFSVKTVVQKIKEAIS
ncbi:MAG: response regulator [SAR324 cluster bacterium]|uniref:Response regulator n=1 Tax=SAR324 cluster bacterium TaxID=2024889 RepID=A0A2A4T4G8_9DELT|nr:MAG: response regulator [SAR324 cluster bacterium]